MTGEALALFIAGLPVVAIGLVKLWKIGRVIEETVVIGKNNKTRLNRIERKQQKLGDRQDTFSDRLERVEEHLTEIRQANGA